MFRLEIITPDGMAYDGDVVSVTLPTAEGEITILPNHIPLIAVVVPGTIVVRDKEGERILAVSRGVLELHGGQTRILADTADRAEDLEESSIRQAKAAAEKLMSERRDDAEGFAEASAVLGREIARLKTIRRHRSRRR